MHMKRSFASYVIIKLIHKLITLIFVILLIYALLRLAPGTPFDQYLYQGKITQEQYERLLEEWGYKDNFITGAAKILYGMFTFSLFKMKSPVYNKPIIDLISVRLPYTLSLVTAAYFFGSMLGILLGLYCARNRGSLKESTILWVVLGIRALPVFWLGMVLLYFLAFKLGLFPYLTTSELEPQNVFHHMIDWLWHSFLPIVALSKIYAVSYLLTIRNMVTEEYTSDYVTALRAIGLREEYIVERHVLRNIMPPVITMMAIDLGFLFGGAVVTETVFNYPGMGTLIYDAMWNKDYPVVVASFYIIAVAVIVAITIAEITYAYLDPRIRRG
ncbi:ABC transporter permease [Thermococcus sp. M39]|nr:ABC transporter permease [Thermococcus sp. M39]NJE13021.1 ABC transporter permease [Thermococcus sp. LS2]